MKEPFLPPPPPERGGVLVSNHGSVTDKFENAKMSFEEAVRRNRINWRKLQMMNAEQLETEIKKLEAGLPNNIGFNRNSNQPRKAFGKQIGSKHCEQSPDCYDKQGNLYKVTHIPHHTHHHVATTITTSTTSTPPPTKKSSPPSLHTCCLGIDPTAQSQPASHTTRNC